MRAIEAQVDDMQRFEVQDLNPEPTVVSETMVQMVSDMFYGVNNFALKKHHNYHKRLQRIPPEAKRPFLTGRRRIELGVGGDHAEFRRVQIPTSTTITGYVKDVLDEVNLLGYRTVAEDVYRLVFASTDQNVVREYKNHLRGILFYGISTGEIEMDRYQVGEIIELIHPYNKDFNMLRPSDQMLEITGSYETIRSFPNALQIMTFFTTNIEPALDIVIGLWKDQPENNALLNQLASWSCGPDLLSNLFRKTVSRINTSFDKDIMNESFIQKNRARSNNGEPVSESLTMDDAIRISLGLKREV